MFIKTTGQPGLTGKIVFALFCCLFAVSCGAERAGQPHQETSATQTPDLEALIGVWDVQLYYDPDQEPSSTVMEIIALDNGDVSGSFYGTPFSTARATIHRGEVIFSALTADGTGSYAHAARLRLDGRLEGQTLSEGRNFIMAWDAAKQSQTEQRD